MESSQQAQVPIVRYGEENKNIPGDPTGWKMKDCGNICHWSDAQRFMKFPHFHDSDFQQRQDPRISLLRNYLADVSKHGVSAISGQRTIVRDTDQEFVIKHQVEDMEVRLVQLHDVSNLNKASYEKAARAVKLEKQSNDKMEAIEPQMGRNLENFLMAERMHKGEAPVMPMHRPTSQNPEPSQNRKQWYKEMRQDSTRTFWVKTTREQRDNIRTAAAKPPMDLLPIIEQIRQEDKSRTQDYYWQHQRDEAAAADEELYENVSEDIVIVLDKDSQILLCKFRGLFQLLYGSRVMMKVDDAVRQWSGLAPLPVPDTSRHIVDDFIRQTHTELDLEKAHSVEEIEKRHQCVVHYGTWAMRGRRNPDHVFLTPDTQLKRGVPQKIHEDFVSLIFPTFREKVLGLGSEVVRYLFGAVAPSEYQECCDVFKALPEIRRMGMSEPTFSTLAVLGINSFTGRHRDETDVNFGLAGLVALGQFNGGNICFPQLAMALDYQPGDCVLFRGAEMEHFVSDWTGYRIFLLYTNHQPVRNYAHRIMGKLPPKSNDPWHPDRIREQQQEEQEEQENREEGDEGEHRHIVNKWEPKPESEPDLEAYDPCYMELAEPEPETLYEADIHGAGYISKKHLFKNDDTGSTGTSSESRGFLVYKAPSAN